MIKIMIAVVILACIGPFFIDGPDGEPLVTIEDLTADFSLPDMDMFTAGSGDKENSQPVEVYKWQDEAGDWHFSNKPEDAEGAETVEVQETNTMPAFKAPKKAKTRVAVKGQPDAMPIPSISQGLETLNQAKQLQSTIDQRKADMDKLTQMDGKQ
jgi:hypothetical protein